ncbi:hypothetical protein BGZ83_003026, partial [Gryganskiella cystojenkinii]
MPTTAHTENPHLPEVIQIDDVPSIGTPSPLTRAWVATLNCQAIWDWVSSNQVPSFSADVLSIKHDEPSDYCDVSDLHTLRHLPFVTDLQDKRTDYLSLAPPVDGRRDAWLTIEGKALTSNAITALPQALETLSLLRQMRGMKEWLEQTVSQFDASFASSFLDLMEQSTLHRMFNEFGEPIKLTDTLRFADVEWLNETCLDAILSSFRHEYGCHGQSRSLFIPMAFITALERFGLDELTFREFGGDINWMGNELRQGVFTRAYAVVPMLSHWGAISIDLKDHRISFGDSMNQEAPVMVIDGVVSWLKHNLQDQEVEWNIAAKSVGKLSVMRQKDSGSCGVFAALAIEEDISH